MARLDRIVAQHRDELLAREANAAGRMIRAYGQAYQRIQRDLARVLDKIQRAREAGEEISPAWLFQQGRLEALKRQVEIQIARFAEFADRDITSTQQEAVDLGRQHAVELMAAALPPAPHIISASVNFQRLPDDTFQDLVGRLSDGSPLRDILNQLPSAASQGLERALLQSVALGLNPKEAVRAVRGELGANLQRAMTVARTEVIRSYREASRRDYDANSDIVQGWIWQADVGPRTCAMCFAMQGSFHTLDEPLDGHPNCRCTMLPQTKSWEEMGYTGIPDTRPTVENGEDLFAQQSPETQEKVLGKEGYALYKSGEVKLNQFVGQRENADWGSMRYTRSLKQIREDPEGDRNKPGTLSPVREQNH